MFRLIPTWRLAARHGRSNWRLMGVLGIGILVAAVLLASAPIYARAMADLGLTFRIREEVDDRPGAIIEVSNVPMATADGLALRDTIEGRIDERIGWFSNAQQRSLELPRLRYAPAGGEQPNQSPVIHLQTQHDYESHVMVVEGRLPEASQPGGVIEVAMSPQIAGRMSLKVGDQFDLLENFDSCERELPQGDNPPPPPPCDSKAITQWRQAAVLVGLVQPLDVNDTFWINGTGVVFDPQPPIQLPGEGINVALLVNEATITEGFAGTLPAYYTLTRWSVFTDPETLSRRNFQRAISDIDGLQKEMGDIGGFVYGPLEDTLRGFEKSAGFQQTPLTILLLEIAGVALFYTALVAATVVERQNQEITLFRSRGASTWQIASIYLLEGLYLAIPIVIVAPFVAAVCTAMLGFTPLFEDVTHGEALPVVVPPVAFGMAAIGAALGLLALLLPVIVVAGRGALAHRRGMARPGAGFVQRYYLDLVFAGLAGLLLWELNEKGSAFEPSATGGVSSDPLLLASPALIIAAVAALILRFYPIVLKLAARIVSVAKAFTLTMSIWQLSRSPGQYTRLALLLMMAIAVGTYAASYSSTAERSYEDRANFDAGVEMRAFPSGTSRLTTPPPETEAKAAALEGVEAVSAVYRNSTAELSAPGGNGQPFQALGVDPGAVGEMLWFRDDFADTSLDSLLRNLEGPSDLTGKPVAGIALTMSVWVNPADNAADTTLRARFRDSAQNNWTVDLGQLGPSGWHELTGNVVNPDDLRGLVPPFRLMSFEVYEPPNQARGAQKPVAIDDITVTSDDGTVTLVEDFEKPNAGWTPLPQSQTVIDSFALATDNPHGGRQYGVYSYSAPAQQSTTEAQGFYVADVIAPLAVLASDGFSASTGIHVGGTGLADIKGHIVPFRVVANYHSFPTLRNGAGPSLVFNRDQLLSWMNSFSLAQTAVAEELWFSLEDGADVPELGRQLFAAPFGIDSRIDRNEALRQVKSNPLIVAGGSGILVVAFFAVLALVGAAMLVSLWTAVQRRRVEFAVMRALGTSRGQVFRVLTIEYLVVIAVGLAGGAYLGLFVARRMLSFLNVTEDGGRVEPSFILQTDWGFVAASCAVVLVVFAVAMVFAVRQLARISDGQALRTE